MISPGLWDKELQMFRDATRDVDLEKLRFLRWLAEHGKLEHEIFGPPTGECVDFVAGAHPPTQA